MRPPTAPPSGSGPTYAASEPTGLAWALWPVLAALPWLLPTHSDPWTTFYSESLMAAALVPVAAWALLARGAWRIDAVTAVLLALALVPVAQALGGLFALPGEAGLIALYFTGMALTVTLAQRAHALAGLKLADALFASLVLAALASTGLALFQWLDLDQMSFLMAPGARTGRPAANLGQPNNLSTLLVWGLVALWWGHARGKLAGGVVCFAAAFLLLGIGLTQSRTGILAVGLLGAGAWLWRRPLGTQGQARAFVALALWFAVVLMLLQPASQFLMRSTAAPGLAQHASAGVRPAIWALALEAIAQRPWAGWGWNQSVQAHVELAAHYPALRVAVAHAHNVVLDLLLWNGIPLGALLLAALGLLAWHHLRRPPERTQALLLLALATFGLHALLELPHVYAFFLLPATLMLGTLGALRPLPALVLAPRAAAALTVVLHAGVLAAMFVDYTRIEDDAMRFRFRAANIGIKAPAPPPEIVLLRPLQTALTTFRQPPHAGMDAAERADWRRILGRYPTPFGLFRYAQASALNGQPGEARWALVLVCTLYNDYFCSQAQADWQTLSEQPDHAAMKALPPPWR